ncbi:hypothetical protein GCM10023317_44280 [Actinopolymorpha pittospori]
MAVVVTVVRQGPPASEMAFESAGGHLHHLSYPPPTPAAQKAHEGLHMPTRRLTP